LALSSSDLFSNLAYGRLVFLGQNPYRVGPSALGAEPLVRLVAPRWIDTPSLYGPVPMLVDGLAAAIGQISGAPIWGSFWGLKLVLLGASVAALVLAQRYVRSHRPDPNGVQGWVLFAFSPLLAWEVSAQAHNDGLMVCALVAFVWAASSGRTWTAVLALTLGALSKLTAAPILLLYLAVLARSSPLGAAAKLFGSLTLGAILFLPFWDGVLLRPGAILEGMDFSLHAHSLADLLMLGEAQFLPWAQRATYHFFRVSSFLLVGWIFFRALLRVRSLEQVVRETILLFFAFFLTTPWFQPWYATWLLPFGLVEHDPGWQRLIFVFAVISVIQWALPLDPLTTVIGNAYVAREFWRQLRTPKSVKPVSRAGVATQFL
jgi:alpha-1,6-mannosyltransferase